MSTTKRSNLSVQYLTRIALLAAVASVLFLIEIPVVAFYKLDLSNLPVMLAAFSMGPVPALITLGAKSLLGLLHTTSAGVGELADFIMGAALVLPAALFYKANKTRKGALVGMLIGTVCMILVSVLVNWLIMIPFYMNAYGMPMAAVVGMAQKALPFVDTELKLLLCVTAPFNLLKGVVLSILTYIIYKPLSPILKVKR
ncbi:MAG: ECF transporter S component [Clostridia bacterium]|nr:ECF transporter S component [Clostridia bacterium]